MVFYLITFGTFAFLSYWEVFFSCRKRATHIFFILATMFLLVLSSIRCGILGDYETYETVFSQMVNVQNWADKNNFLFEPLYSALQLLCKGIYDNFAFFVLTLAALVMCLQYKYVFYASEHTLYSDGRDKSYYLTLLFIIWGLYFGNIFVIRSTVAAAICFYSMRFIEKKQVTLYLLCVTTAVLFHSSAAIFFLAYVIYHFKSSLKVKLFITTLASCLLEAFLRPVALFSAGMIGGRVCERVTEYMQNDNMHGTMFSYSAAVIMGKAVINVGFLLLIFLYLWKYFKHNRVFEGYLNLYLAGCILYLGTMFISYSFSRIAIYFNVFQVVLIGFYFKMSSRLNRVFYWHILTLYIFVRYIVTIYSNFEAYVPFQTIILK